MQCPKCRQIQVFDGAECERCGIVFARFRAAPAASSPAASSAPDAVGDTAAPEAARAAAPPAPVAASSVSAVPQDGPLGEELALPRASSESEEEAEQCIDTWGWIAFGIGLTLALLTELLPVLRILIGYFVTLVHEMGHAATGWLFGYPSIPAFDFRYGGGFTSQQDQVTLLVVLVYAAMAALLWVFRRNGLSLGIVLGAVIVYSLLLWSRGHEMLILAMGHGSELLFALLFIHRALSGRGCYHAGERPLYAWIGFHVVFHDMRFAYGLLTSELAREIYGQAKGGGHWMDFSRLATEYLSVRLELVAGIFLLLCLLPPILAVLVNLARPFWSGLRERLGEV